MNHYIRYAVSIYDATVPKITSVIKIKCVLYNESIYIYTTVMPLASTMPWRHVQHGRYSSIH